MNTATMPRVHYRGKCTSEGMLMKIHRVKTASEPQGGHVIKAVGAIQGDGGADLHVGRGAHLPERGVVEAADCLRGTRVPLLIGQSEADPLLAPVVDGVVLL